MKELLGFIEDDWRRIPANYRYVFFAGVSLIALAWLGDHWGNQQQYRVPLFRSNECAFQAGIYVLGVFFIILIAKQFKLWLRIRYFRQRYPANKANQEFYLVSFQGAIYLLDNDTKRRFHLKTPQTVTDLGFWLLGWTEIPHDARPEDEILLARIGKTIRLNDYEDVPGGIFTQP